MMNLLRGHGFATFQRRSFMEPTNCQISQNLPLKRLVTNAMGEIERLGYSRRSRNRYRAIWEHLIEFSDRNELRDEFSGDLAVRFLEECRIGNEEMERPARGWRKHIVRGTIALPPCTPSSDMFRRKNRTVCSSVRRSSRSP